MANQGETWSWGDISDGVSPRTETVDLVLDGNIAAQIEEARRRLKEAEREDSLDGKQAKEAREELERLEEVAQASVRTFTVRSVGYRRWRELLESCPSDDPDERWNAETFIPAVLLEACDQFTSEEDVEQAINVLSTGQIAKLFGKARLVNEGDDSVPLVRGR